MGLLADLAQKAEAAWDTLRRITETPDRLDAAEERMDQMASANQEYLDEIATGIRAARTSIETKLDELEAESDLDFSGVRAELATLGALGESVPDPTTPLPPVTSDPEPVDPSAPADEVLAPGEGDAQLV